MGDALPEPGAGMAWPGTLDGADGDPAADPGAAEELFCPAPGAVEEEDDEPPPSCAIAGVTMIRRASAPIGLYIGTLLARAMTANAFGVTSLDQSFSSALRLTLRTSK